MFGDTTPTPYADFDQSVDPVNSYGQGSGGGDYTVRAGDTLQSLALMFFGDQSLWYRIAEANGLSGGAALGMVG
jgi:nucleoid-associated protein YgaU